LPTGKKKKTTARTTAGSGTKPTPPEAEEPTKETSGEEAAEVEKVPAVTTAAAAPEPEESDIKESELAKPGVPVQVTRESPGEGGEKESKAEAKTEPVTQKLAVPSDQSPPAAVEGAPVAPAAGGTNEVPAQEAPGSPAAAGGEKPEVKPPGEPQVPAAEVPNVQPAPAAVEGAPVAPTAGGTNVVPTQEAPGSPAAAGGEKPEVKPPGEPLVQETAAPTGQPAPVAGGEDDFSMFDSQADLEEIFSAMEDVKKDEANAIATAVQALESGQDAATALQSVSTEVAEKIQKQLEERTAAEEEHFVTEEEFVSHAKSSVSKT
jgi:hypothetical protein